MSTKTEETISEIDGRPETILQTCNAFCSEPPQPLEAGALADAGGITDLVHGPALVRNPLHEQGSTFRRQSRMLMAVHPFS